MALGKNGAAGNLELDASATENKDGKTPGSNEQPGGVNSGSGGGRPHIPAPDKKIGFAVFVQRAKPNKYVEAMLKNRRAMEAHTLAEWQQIVKDLLNKKVS